MTPAQEEEIHLSGLALSAARDDLYACEQRAVALEAELRAARLEREWLAQVVTRAEIALSKAKSAAKKRGKK